jgi:AcrR family transcriptional regulator
MPRPRFATADAQLRDRILEEATQEFAQKGYEAASLNRILLASGLSKGSFYYYFDDKADLAAAVVALVMGEVEPAIDALGKPKDAKEFWLAFERYAKSALEIAMQTPERANLATKLGVAFADHPELAAKVMPLAAPVTKKFIAFLKQGQKVGAVRSDLSPEVQMQLINVTKTTLVGSAIPRDRTVTRAEMEKFSALAMDLYRRIARP